jgi:hypothetical protein
LFWAIVPNRFEELNNYSGRMTRRKYDSREPTTGIADRGIWVGGDNRMLSDPARLCGTNSSGAAWSIQALALPGGCFI